MGVDVWERTYLRVDRSAAQYTAARTLAAISARVIFGAPPPFFPLPAGLTAMEEFSSSSCALANALRSAAAAALTSAASPFLFFPLAPASQSASSASCCLACSESFFADAVSALRAWPAAFLSLMAGRRLA